jgi:chromosome segregation ATPase
MQKFADEISSLKLENEDLKLKLNNSMTNLDNKIKQYSKIIEVQTEKLTKKETENMELKKNIFELNEKINNNSNITKEEIENLKKEKNHFEILFKQTENEKKEIKNKYEESLNNIKNLEEEKKNNLERIHQQEINGIKLAQKLTEYKNLLIQINTKIQIFHVQRINTFTKSEMDITFGQDKNNNFVMKIDDGDSASLVNIEDIESVKQLDKNKLEIKYMFNSKKYKINIIVDELIIDQFITAYNDFYLRSVKEKNNIKY